MAGVRGSSRLRSKGQKEAGSWRLGNLLEAGGVGIIVLARHVLYMMQNLNNYFLHCSRKVKKYKKCMDGSANLGVATPSTTAD
jgi:hypothetical protein